SIHLSVKGGYCIFMQHLVPYVERPLTLGNVASLFQRGDVTFSGEYLIPSRVSGVLHRREFYHQVISRGGIPKLVQRCSAQNHAVGGRHIHDKEG
ncbi:hypothetical protein U1Q18_007501, partial [Sarracenia purpurea var. burkii]